MKRSKLLDVLGAALLGGALLGCSDKRGEDARTSGQSVVVGNDECRVEYRVVNSWQGGFQAEVSLQSHTPLDGWNLQWAFKDGQQIQNLWNGILAQSGPSVRVDNVDYNEQLAADQSTSFGFTASAQNINTAPEDFLLNGQSCAGDVCVPNCDGRQCGPDGCKGTCGSCSSGVACSALGQCESTSSDQGPYAGHAVSIPGRVQAENYDLGGAGVAYSDTTSGNAGGSYRNDDVDLEVSSAGGFNVGWTAAGEWLEYTVNVAQAGTYAITFSVASLSTGGRLHLQAKSENVTGAVALPATGGWQAWVPVVVPRVTLAAGSNVLRLVAETGGFNIDWFEIRSSAPDGGISRYLVGNNVWYPPISNANWSLAGQAGLQLVRIGGISFDRNIPSIANLEDWVRRIKAMGAEPMIQVSQFRSAADAAALVRHFNVATNNRVLFWNIGNEPWLERDRPSLSTMPGIIAPYVKSHASAMKAVDPSIKIYAPDMCDFFESVYQELLGTGTNNIAGRDSRGNYYIDGISWHRYVGGALATSGAADFQSRIERSAALVRRSNETHGRTGASALGWGIGEFNSNGGAAVHTFANGQMFGQVLGHAMKHNATYVATWSIFENGGSRTGTDFSFIDGINGKPRASYYHMQMVSQNFTGTAYVDSASSVVGVRVFSAKASDRVVVMPINVDAGSHGLSMRFDNVTPTSGDARIRVAAAIAGQYSGTIGAQETQVLVFDNAGRLTRRTTYNAGHFDQNPPVVQRFTP